MQVTLLYVVQSYLNATDGWEVGSIFDTTESEQVASIARDIYNQLISDTNYQQYQEKVMQLGGLGDTSRPNYMKIPIGVQRVRDSIIQYNNVTETATNNYVQIDYLPPTEFLRRIAKRSYNDDMTNVELCTDDSGVEFPIYNDRVAEYCTSFDQKLLVFDSYNKEYDDTMMKSKSRMVANVLPQWIHSDDFIIPLPEQYTQGYIDMVKAEASESLRQESLPSAARRARKFLIKQRQIGDRIGNHPKLGRKYGRRGSTNYYGRNIQSRNESY